MRNIGWWIYLIVIGFVLLVFNATSFAFNDTKESRETLRGVKPVYVVIEGITPEFEQNGMSVKQLKTAVEKQLSKAGINVIATVDAEGSAGLYVRMNTLKSDILKSEFNIDYYAISISVELIQRCVPLTVKNIDSSYISSHSTLACTWSTSNIYLVGERRIGNIHDCVKELVEHFIDVYVSANLKQ